MRKPKSKGKQLAAQKRAAKRNRRDIKVRNESHARRVKYDYAKELAEHSLRKFMDKIDDAQKNFEETNGSV
jgi:hypothetical protein